MRVLIIEPLSSGHRGVYAMRLAEGLIESGCDEVCLATTETASKHVAFRKCLGESRIKLCVFPDGWLDDVMGRNRLFGLIAREYYCRRFFREIYKVITKRCRVDHVIIPYLDYCLHAMALQGSPFGSAAWSGIAMRPSFHYSRTGVIAPSPRFAWVRERIFLRLLKQTTLANLFSIDISLCNYISRFFPRESEKLIYLADPADELESIPEVDSRESLGIPVGCPLILVFGAITFRKGVKELLTSACHADFPMNVNILLAGKQSNEAELWIRENPCAQKLVREGRLHILNDFLDVECQSLVFSASNIVWVGYRNHYGMSGVLVQAGFMRLPVLADKRGLLGWYTNTYKLGKVVDSSDSDEIRDAVISMISDRAGCIECGTNGAKVFVNNTTLEFIRTISRRLL